MEFGRWGKQRFGRAAVKSGMVMDTRVALRPPPPTVQSKPLPHGGGVGSVRV